MPRQIGQTLDFGGTSRLLNVPTPVQNSEPATKAYVDSAIEGLAWKDNVRVATQANVNLSAPGATIDGITMVTGDRFLAPAQTAAAENGIYIWNGAGVVATRSPDANTFDELEQAVVTVDEGTSAGASFRQTQVNGTLNSSAVQFVSFGATVGAASEGGAGISAVATQAEVNAGVVDNKFVSPLKLANWTGRIRKYATDFGDGTNTQYTITHNLNTRDVTVSIHRNSGAYDEVLVDVEKTTVNTVVVRFAVAPTANQFRAVIVG